MPGSHRDSCGNAIIMAKNARHIAMKGKEAFISSRLGILKTLLVKNKLMPMGGVISPISIFTTYQPPIHKGSNPICVNMGTRIGVVSNKMVIPSRKHPKSRRKILTEMKQ